MKIKLKQPFEWASNETRLFDHFHRDKVRAHLEMNITAFKKRRKMSKNSDFRHFAPKSRDLCLTCAACVPLVCAYFGQIAAP